MLFCINILIVLDVNPKSECNCNVSFTDLGLHANNKSTFTTDKVHQNLIDQSVVGSEEESECDILDLTATGSLNRTRGASNPKHYGSVCQSQIPTVGKNNFLPRGGMVANAFCYNEFLQPTRPRAATPSKTNPNVLFLHRSNSNVSAARSDRGRSDKRLSSFRHYNAAFY